VAQAAAASAASKTAMNVRFIGFLSVGSSERMFEAQDGDTVSRLASDYFN
jgi:hypothetical protein